MTLNGTQLGARDLSVICTKFRQKCFSIRYSLLVELHVMIYPQPIRRHYHPKCTLITLALVSHLRSLVVRAVHRHRTGVGSIPAGGLYIVDEFFATVPG